MAMSETARSFFAHAQVQGCVGSVLMETVVRMEQSVVSKESWSLGAYIGSMI